MTVQEIHKEVFKDVRNLKGKLYECRKKFKKLVLRGSRYPLTKSFDCKTKERKNIFIVTFHL